jgi:hypothetical protein
VRTPNLPWLLSVIVERAEAMTDHKFRTPVEETYLHAIGRAVYNFASLEWNIVWLCQVLEPGFVFEAGSLTTGQVREKFTGLVSALPPDDPDRSALVSLVETFSSLVKRRDMLVHGKPSTAPDGEQRLYYSGKRGAATWSVAAIFEAAQDFEIASRDAHHLYDKCKP